MIVKVNNEVPDWWIDAEDVPAKYRAWQDQPIPPEECGLDLECITDSDLHTFFDRFGLEWMYKFIAHRRDLVVEGITEEFDNIFSILFFIGG